ncbi:MAG: dynamin family protein [Pseudomonadota bacterium]
MMTSAGKTIKQRLKSLEEHLTKENPVLVAAVDSYRQLDRVGRALGLLGPEQSFATQISWWPMISVLGTFSAGKSTFINHYLGETLQSTGNQAVDDKFTVICYGGERHAQAIPGTALDADPRFPFYQISKELEHVARGEGRRVDAYLQLKTSASAKLRGRIIIDSPGFDADSQRNATLRLTDHIIDLSDLVLVFFDARHPEPGAMRDTLTHLVGQTIHRADATKFLFILNQIDTTARDDNPEAVVGAWQRALAQEGLTAGRFYCIYNPEAAVTIADEAQRRRYESKRDQDLAEIYRRIEGVNVERAYRITGALEKLAHQIEEKVVPQLLAYKAHWKKLTLWGDGILAGVLLLLVFMLSGMLGFRAGWHWSWPSWWTGSTAATIGMLVFLAVAVGAVAWLHYKIRKFAAGRVVRLIGKQFPAGLYRNRLVRAFLFNTRPWLSIFIKHPIGWGQGTRKRLQRIVGDANQYVQTLNDHFTDPSGSVAAAVPPAVVASLSVVEPARTPAPLTSKEPRGSVQG